MDLESQGRLIKTQKNEQVDQHHRADEKEKAKVRSPRILSGENLVSENEYQTPRAQVIIIPQNQEAKKKDIKALR